MGLRRRKRWNDQWQRTLEDTPSNRKGYYMIFKTISCLNNARLKNSSWVSKRVFLCDTLRMSKKMKSGPFKEKREKKKKRKKKNTFLKPSKRALRVCISRRRRVWEIRVNLPHFIYSCYKMLLLSSTFFKVGGRGAHYEKGKKGAKCEMWNVKSEIWNAKSEMWNRKRVKLFKEKLPDFFPILGF